jgi:predicted ester cyclase
VHKGDLLGMPGTGRRIAVNGITIFRLHDGVITEEWTEFDALALLTQLRAEGTEVPAPRETETITLPT